MATSASSLKVFSLDRDDVVDALVATGATNYRYALEKLVPLIDRLSIQRRIQNPKFYERLKRDLLKGCLMPPVTIAFIRKSRRGLSTKEQFQAYVRNNMDKAFVLDGIQRLSTLQRAYSEHPGELDGSKSIFLNILICPSMDNLLYRMITLNNGQKAMTTRHQIEILSENMFTSVGDGIILISEKNGSRRQRGIFQKSDFVLGYMAFLSASTSVDSQKLIEEKLDELIAAKILEHDPTEGGVEFKQVTELVGEYCAENTVIDRWFRTTNNLIGFFAGIRNSYSSIEQSGVEEFAAFVQRVDEALTAFDVSKVRLGSIRRKAVAYSIKNFDSLEGRDTSFITEQLAELLD